MEGCSFAVTPAGTARPTRVFFRREQGGLFGLRKVVCDGCLAYQPTADDRRYFKNSLILRALWLLPLIVAGFNNWSQGLLLFALAGSALTASTVTVTVHEFGHAILARLCGLAACRS